MTFVVLLLSFVVLQRLGELVLARRNTRRLLARGAYEVGAGHYPLIVALHAAWLLGLCWFARDAAIQPAWAVAYLVLQGFRAWILASLGERWTTRIIILPDEPLVRRGPYRLMPHPNYVLVAAEIAVLPLALGLETYALVFSLLNALVLAVRIRAEGRALAPLRGV